MLGSCLVVPGGSRPSCGLGSGLPADPLLQVEAWTGRKVRLWKDRADLMAAALAGGRGHQAEDRIGF